MTESGVYRNGNGRLTTWLLGLFGTILILILGFLINGMLSMNSRMEALEVLSASNAEKVKHLEATTLNIVPDKLEYVVKHSELISKVSSIDSSQKILEARLNTISERLFVVSTNVDRLNLQDGIKDKLKKE